MDRILCRHNITGHTTEFPEDALTAWQALGWTPVADEPPSEPAAPVEATSAATPSTRPARVRATSTEES